MQLHSFLLKISTRAASLVSVLARVFFYVISRNSALTLSVRPKNGQRQRRQRTTDSGCGLRRKEVARERLTSWRAFLSNANCCWTVRQIQGSKAIPPRDKRKTSCPFRSNCNTRNRSIWKSRSQNAKHEIKKDDECGKWEIKWDMWKW